MSPRHSAHVRGCLIDLDGTVYEAGAPVKGAVEAIAALRSAHIPFRFVTNTTRRPRWQVVQELNAMGIDATDEECLTAPVAAAEWLRGRGAERIDLLLPQATFEEFEGFCIDREQPEFVVVGDLGSAWSYEILNRALRQLLSGADLIAIQRNRFWETAEGPSLDAGAFVAALEYASGKAALVVGKPSAAFFETACAALHLEPHEVAMIGDDLEADVRGARRTGLLAIAVRTGKARHESIAECSDGATVVLDSIADLPRWLGIAVR